MTGMSNFFTDGNMSGLPAEYQVQTGTDAAPAFVNWGQSGADQADPNAAIYQFQQAQTQPVSGQYGYDPSANQGGMSAADMSAFIGGGGQSPTQIQQAYQGMYAQPQMPQFQQSPAGYPQGYAQPQPPQFQQQPPAGYPQNFNPQFGQGQLSQGQFGQPSAQQGQGQPTPQNLTPAQFFQGAVPPMPNQAPQFQQQPPAGYPQGYAQPQVPQYAPDPTNPYAQQQGQPFPQPLPGYPTGDFGFAPQPWQQPGYAQQQGLGQQYPQTHQAQYGQPQGQQFDPTAQIKQEINSLEEKIAANRLAQTSAANLNDQASMLNLAREDARLNGQLMAAYVREQTVAENHANTQLAGVRSDYTRQMATMLQSQLGYVPQQADLMEFNYLLDMIATPETAASLQTPAVRDMVLKSYAYDKMMRVRGQAPRQAPRDYVPTGGGMAFGGPNNFGAGQRQNVPVGFAAMDDRQAIQFLTTGTIPGRR